MNTTNAPRNGSRPTVNGDQQRDRREFLLVCEKPCDQCLFSHHKIVSDERRAEVLRECKEKDSPFVCHKHSVRASQERGVRRTGANHTFCHGYWTRFRGAHLVFRLAVMLGCVRFVDEQGSVVGKQEEEVIHGQ